MCVCVCVETSRGYREESSSPSLAMLCGIVALILLAVSASAQTNLTDKVQRTLEACDFANASRHTVKNIDGASIAGRERDSLRGRTESV